MENRGALAAEGGTPGRRPSRAQRTGPPFVALARRPSPTTATFLGSLAFKLVRTKVPQTLMAANGKPMAQVVNASPFS